uniref:Corrinoid adenosyltransferase n=1 Tax=Prevotella sp. GTC17253 TaxID=3236793 RepID=A0AB33ITW2_9BACT
MTRIYTKTGDGGQTHLRSGVRVDKDDIRIEANGEIDELNCHIGVVCASLPKDDARRQLLCKIQQELMTVMSLVATPPGKENPREEQLEELTSKMESEIDRITLNRKFSFVLPGGSVLQAYLHMARSKARTAERRLWTVNREYPQDRKMMVFMNRLSDYLFALATDNDSDK